MCTNIIIYFSVATLCVNNYMCLFLQHYVLRLVSSTGPSVLGRRLVLSCAQNSHNEIEKGSGNYAELV